MFDLLFCFQDIGAQLDWPQIFTASLELLEPRRTSFNHFEDKTWTKGTSFKSRHVLGSSTDQGKESKASIVDDFEPRRKI